MDAPKCRLCGKREWNHVCREGSPRAPELPPGSEHGLGTNQDDIGAPTVWREDYFPGAGNPPKPRAPRGTFDRTAYQREYMRKKRAANKPKP